MPKKIGLSTMALIFFSFHSQMAVSQSVNSSNVPIELSLTTSNRDVQKGQPLPLRLEFKNVGRDDFFVPKWLVWLANAPAFVVLEFEDSKGSKFKGGEMHGIFSVEGANQWWTDIAPGHYYGIEMTLDEHDYTFLQNPGIYKVTAKYVSKGGITPPSREDWHIPAHDVWKGEILSNVVEFQILPPRAH